MFDFVYLNFDGESQNWEFLCSKLKIYIYVFVSHNIDFLNFLILNYDLTLT